ncbi:hypothetical protein ABIB75_007648 [Bradyrhizobium sp. GM2.2]|uniref:hypothetical protein n=2 Tax=Bradyrhizobium TaxID=374 RepID=UPI00037963C4|nr:MULTISPECIES: hypothetical protein [unclassified Bradyrhizobium]MCK1382313.1 hypothetical protein [Bradyrhizobium sp. 24]MCK1269754.1 hypothetical protein [Bradyrhizobium sp. 84]MCK1293480.1 hypothetical protein [Bradyrhizobium sp. 30]MCK1303745.1 hypothetical protein [Bradyrhizobium sp. 37]MCK1309448.1 hypothetical protein [Bradyrhizobium sp. 45]
MTKTSSTSPSTGGVHDSHDSKNASKTDNKTDTKSAGPGVGNSATDNVGGTGTFEKLIDELKAVNQQAMVQDIKLRALTTELSSERKAASERVNG